MKWRAIGAILLLIAIVLASLTQIPFSTSRSHVLLEQDKLPVPFVNIELDLIGPLPAEKNVTINPLSTPPNSNYVVNVLVNAYAYNVTPTSPTAIDLWIVNHTGSNVIFNILQNGTYPINATEPFIIPGLKTYLESINKAFILRPLEGMDFNGNYTIMIINPYNIEANVTVVVEDTLTTTTRLLQVNAGSVLLPAIIALVGVYMVVKKPKRENRVKRRKT